MNAPRNSSVTRFVSPLFLLALTLLLGFQRNALSSQNQGRGCSDPLESETAFASDSFEAFLLEYAARVHKIPLAEGRKLLGQGFTWSYLPAGTYRIGSPLSDNLRFSSEPAWNDSADGSSRLHGWVEMSAFEMGSNLSTGLVLLLTGIGPEERFLGSQSSDSALLRPRYGATPEQLAPYQTHSEPARFLNYEDAEQIVTILNRLYGQWAKANTSGKKCQFSLPSIYQSLVALRGAPAERAENPWDRKEATQRLSQYLQWRATRSSRAQSERISELDQIARRGFIPYSRFPLESEASVSGPNFFGVEGVGEIHFWTSDRLPGRGALPSGTSLETPLYLPSLQRLEGRLQIVTGGPQPLTFLAGRIFRPIQGTFQNQSTQRVAHFTGVNPSERRSDITVRLVRTCQP